MSHEHKRQTGPVRDGEITPDDYRLDATPVNWAVHFIEGPDGKQQITDITRELRVMYDLVITSMDFGSGFLDREDMETLWRIAELCDFDYPDKDVDETIVLASDGRNVPTPWDHSSLSRDEFYARYEGLDRVEIRETPIPDHAKFAGPEGDQVRLTAVHTGRKRSTAVRP